VHILFIVYFVKIQFCLSTFQVGAEILKKKNFTRTRRVGNVTRKESVFMTGSFLCQRDLEKQTAKGCYSDTFK